MLATILTRIEGAQTLQQEFAYQANQAHNRA